MDVDRSVSPSPRSPIIVLLLALALVYKQQVRCLSQTKRTNFLCTVYTDFEGYVNEGSKEKILPSSQL